MPSKLRRAIDAVKDNTSIGLALVSGFSDIHVAVLRATSHDPSPADAQAVAEFLLLASSKPDPAVRSLSRRLSRTGNWVVAVKCLSLISHGIADAGSDFRREAIADTPRQHRRLLDLSEFRDSSGLSSPWDFTAFVRTFALYLDARLEAFATGKLIRRPRRSPVSGLKPPVLVNRIGHWQRLLDRAMGTRPTGEARGHRLVRSVFHSVVRETFELYRDITDGISFLLDNFFHLPTNLCLEAFQASKVAARQFEELEEFYAGCKKMVIGRPSEYPSVRKISVSLLETLEGFLKEGNGGGENMSRPKLIMDTAAAEEEKIPTESENWELALAESMNELSIKCAGESAKMMESPEKNQRAPFPSGFHNPFMHASYDKSLMAVTPSPSSVKAPPQQKPLLSLTPSPAGLLCGDCKEQGRENAREEEEDPFEALARRERRPLMAAASRDFRAQYHVKGG
ncbi:Clathrin coat assembly protein AP180 [Platanthera zijinensis]|uniref:Clathrin coat assembly protein AP180 n=1 Tax=Platanthera zijinensis TaxID=2320716 RepID=A0AAP0B707_9ASPA